MATNANSTFRAFFFIALIALTALPAFGQTAPPTAGITVSAFDGFEIVTEHKLGNHLYITVDYAHPDTEYTAKLVDETGFVVATRDLKTDAQGWVEPELVWHRSGIVGCSSTAYPDPYTYRFSDYDGADTLAGRTFNLQLLNAAGRIEMSMPIPLVVDHTPRFYFSDATGCPMKVDQLSATDTVWVTGIHLDPTASTDLSVWLLRNPSAWYDDELPLVDARPSFQDSGQLLTFSGTSTKETVPIMGFDDEGDCIWGKIQPPVTNGGEEPGEEPGGEEEPGGSGGGEEDPAGSGGSGTGSEPPQLWIGPNFHLDPFMEQSSASGPSDVDDPETDPGTTAGPNPSVYGSCPPCEEPHCSKPWYAVP